MYAIFLQDDVPIVNINQKEPTTTIIVSYFAIAFVEMCLQIQFWNKHAMIINQSYALYKKYYPSVQ